MENPLFLYEINDLVLRLEYQKERVFEELKNLPHFLEFQLPIHDADYYIILLRRVFREIEELAKHDSKVANLKGKNINLLKKIKIRDHFEHGVDFDKMDYYEDGNMKIVTSMIGNKIISGNIAWDLKEDHDEFINMMDDMIKFLSA